MGYKNGKANTRIRPPPKPSPSKSYSLNIEKKENKGISRPVNKNTIHNHVLPCSFGFFVWHIAKKGSRIIGKSVNLSINKLGGHLINAYSENWGQVFLFVGKSIKNWYVGERDWSETVKDIHIFIMDALFGKWRLSLLLLKDRSEITEDDIADVISDVAVWLICRGLAI